MENKMLNRRDLMSIFLSSSLVLAVSRCIAKSVEKKFIELDTKKITGVPPVLNFFSYACRHCYRFEQDLSRLSTLKEIDIQHVPVALHPSHRLLSETYYSLVSLNKDKALHIPFWDWILHEDHKWLSENDMSSDICRWMLRHGISQSEWEAATRSHPVKQDLLKAQKYIEAFKIDATPCVVVKGRYLTSPVIAGGYQECADTVLTLMSS